MNSQVESEVARNEAAERLLDWCGEYKLRQPMKQWTLEALAVEREAGRLAGIAESANAFAFNERESRRATVERILAAVQKKAARYSKDTATGYQVYSIVRAILDEEAAR